MMQRFALENRIRHERLGRQRFLQRNRHMKARALALLAFHPDIAAHHFGQLAADGQAQAGAAELAGGGGIDLREGLEEPVDLVRRNADAGVADGKEDEVVARFVLRLGHVDADVALRGEAHRVGEKVDQDLAQARDVAGEAGRQVRRDLPEQARRPFPPAWSATQSIASSTSTGEVEGMVLQLELARLDLGEVEDFADDRQKRVGAAGGWSARSRAVPSSGSCRAAGRSCRRSRSSACGFRGSCWPGIPTSPCWRFPPLPSRRSVPAGSACAR